VFFPRGQMICPDVCLCR